MLLLSSCIFIIQIVLLKVLIYRQTNIIFEGGTIMFKKAIAVLCTVSLIVSQGIILNVSAGPDKTAPVFKSSTPKNNQTGIATNAKVSIKFSENIYKSTNYSKIKLTKSGKTVSIKTSISKNIMTVSPKYSLSYNTFYLVSVPAKAVKDKAGNLNKKSFTIKFKTKAKVIHTPTPIPTPTPDPTPAPNTIESAYSIGNPRWQDAAYALGNDYSGFQKIVFDITPLKEYSDSQIGYVDSSTVFEKADPDYYKLAIIVRLNSEGYFDVFDSGGPAQTSFVKYFLNIKYHVEIQVNVKNRLYSVWVTPAGGSKMQIAANYHFRNTSELDDIGKVCFISDSMDNVFFVENHVISSVTAPTPTPSPTVAPTPAAASVTVNNDSELSAALNNNSIGKITFAAGPYSGFSVNRPVSLTGNGVSVTSSITVNSSNVTIDNFNINLGKSYEHGININAGSKNTKIKNGSINGPVKIMMTRGIVIAPSRSTDVTVTDVDFSNLYTSIVTSHGGNEGCKFSAIDNTFFSTAQYHIGGTENTELGVISGNIFNAGKEGIGLGVGVTTSVAGQNEDTIVDYLLTNNTFDTTLTTNLKRVVDYRVFPKQGY
jgi:methionine-rich copper-binding protein CopC